MGEDHDGLDHSRRVGHETLGVVLQLCRGGQVPPSLGLKDQEQPVRLQQLDVGEAAGLVVVLKAESRRPPGLPGRRQQPG